MEADYGFGIVRVNSSDFDVNVEEVAVEIATADFNAVKVREQMMAKRFVDEARLVEDANDVDVVLEVEQKAVGVSKEIMATRFEFEKNYAEKAAAKEEALKNEAEAEAKQQAIAVALEAEKKEALKVIVEMMASRFELLKVVAEKLLRKRKH